MFILWFYLEFVTGPRISQKQLFPVVSVLCQQNHRTEILFPISLDFITKLSIYIYNVLYYYNIIIII